MRLRALLKIDVYLRLKDVWGLILNLLSAGKVFQAAHNRGNYDTNLSFLIDKFSIIKKKRIFKKKKSAIKLNVRFLIINLINSGCLILRLSDGTQTSHFDMSDFLEEIFKPTSFKMSSKPNSGLQV